MAQSVTSAGGEDTFPKLLIRNARIWGDRPAIREKDLGIWQTWTWAEVREEVQALAAGLSELGLERGDKVAIVGSNRPRLYWTICAVQSLGGIPVPVYQDAVAAEMVFVLQHAEARLAVVQDQEQVDKLLSLSEDLPDLRHVIYDEERGLKDYDHTRLHSFASIQESGRAQLAAGAAARLDASIQQGKGSDIAVILYTSGTTGQPKGVMLSYDNTVISAKLACEFDHLTKEDEVLAYLPMAWVGDHIFSYAESYWSGFCVACPESPETMLQDLREIGPTYFFSPPRIFENLLTTVMIRMEDASPLKKRMFHYFLGVARRAGEKILNGEPVPVSDRILYGIGKFLVYEPLKNVLGMSRMRVGYTAGEAIGPEIFRFYRSLGLNLKQLYGQTEASVYVTVQPDGEIRADTVGKPAPQVEIRIDDTGEVLYRSPGVFVGYYKNEEATRATKTADGWVHTGDAGFFDNEGHLRIIDRAKDVGHLKDGTLFAPKYVENKLKFFPNIKEAVALGHEREFVTAMLNIDLGAVGSWAERNNVAYASYQELAGMEQIYDMLEAHVVEVNRDLSQEPRMAGSQIHRFLILHKELDADDGELTRTQKVRRGYIADKYQPLIDALYDGSKAQDIETEVTFEDGRKGRIRARVEIRDVQVFGTQEHREAAE
ncbi:AMP-dependent synthetase/ligase [Microbaculum marinum]|uniref:AMP-binding protein n=1 Tax=Microbaculum marinum TaxID=1764581 RepID=A0AAW9RJF9_9HYPH